MLFRYSNVKINYGHKNRLGEYCKKQNNKFKAEKEKYDVLSFYFRRVFFKGDSDHVYGLGDTIYRPRLGKTLSLIAEHGPSVLYDGALSDAVCEEIQRQGGIINRHDLKTYEARIKPAVKVTLGDDYSAYGVPPPASSAITLLILKVMDGMSKTAKNKTS